MRAAGSPAALRTGLLALAGAAFGFAGSLCGIGGGLFAVPLLHFVLGVDLRRAVATALVLVLATTSAATAADLLHPRTQLDLRATLLLAAGAFLGAGAGYRFSRRVSRRALRALFALVLALAGARVLLLAEPSGTPASPVLGGAVVAAAGFAGGFASPLFGIAGGLVMVPGLFLGAGMPFATARACSLAAGAVAALRALVLHARAGNVRWPDGLGLGAGAALGASLAVILLVDPRWVELGRILLGVLLLLTALRFLWDARRDPAPL